MSPAATSAAFDDALQQYLSDLRYFAFTLVATDEVDDLVQDTLARAWLKRGQFDQSRGNLKPWLFAIMKDLARQRWRRQRRMDLRVEFPREAVITEQAEWQIDLRVAVDGLPLRQRCSVILVYYLDLSVVEAAEVMSCSAGTIKSNLYDARKRLSEKLGDGYGPI